MKYLYFIWSGFDDFSLPVFNLSQLKAANVTTVRKQSKRPAKTVKTIIANKLFDPVLVSRLCQRCNKSHSIKPYSS